MVNENTYFVLVGLEVFLLPSSNIVGKVKGGCKSKGEVSPFGMVEYIKVCIKSRRED